MSFSDADRKFQQEVRAWLADAWPEEMRKRQARSALGRLSKEDHVRWQKALAAKGWAAVDWPKEHGGAAFTPTQNYIFDLERARVGAPAVMPFGMTMVAPVIMKFGTRRAEAPIPARHSQHQRVVVSGLLRTRLGLGSRLAADQSRGQGRPLPRQRREDLDDAGAIRRLDLLSRAHEPGSETADGHQFSADRHALARRNGESDRHAGSAARSVTRKSTWSTSRTWWCRKRI